MSGGLSVIPVSLPSAGIPFLALITPSRDSLVIPAMAEQSQDFAQRQLLGILTPTELMAEIVAIDGGLDVVR